MDGVLNSFELKNISISRTKRRRTTYIIPKGSYHTIPYHTKNEQSHMKCSRYEDSWRARSRTSVDRAPTQCSGGDGFDSYRDSDIIFLPRSCYVD